MTKKRQKRKPAPKKAQATEAPKGATRRQLRQALRRLQRLQVARLETNARAALRKMQQSAETFDLFAAHRKGALPQVLEAVQGALQTVEAHLRTAKAIETREQKRWKKWKKDPPKKRLKELEKMILQAQEGKEDPRRFQDARPWQEAAKFFPIAKDLAGFLALRKNLPKLQAVDGLAGAFLKAESAFFEARKPLRKFLSAWEKWLEAYNKAKAAGLKIEELPQEGQLQGKEGQNKSEESKSGAIEGKNPFLPLDGNAPKEGGKDL